MELEMVEKASDENAKIRGSLGRLSDGRLVFIGEAPDDHEAWYIAFRNAAGDDTRLRLSKEAMAMLAHLYKQHPKGDDIWPMQIKMAWRVTVSDKEPEPSAPSPTPAAKPAAEAV